MNFSGTNLLFLLSAIELAAVEGEGADDSEPTLKSRQQGTLCYFQSPI